MEPVDDIARVATVQRVWAALAAYQTPLGFFTDDAEIVGSSFGAHFTDEHRPDDRWAAIEQRGPDYVVALRDALPAPGGRVLAVGVAGWGGSGELVGVVYDFEGDKISRSHVHHDVDEAFLAAGLERSGDLDLAPHPPAHPDAPAAR